MRGVIRRRLKARRACMSGTRDKRSGPQRLLTKYKNLCHTRCSQRQSSLWEATQRPPGGIPMGRTNDVLPLDQGALDISVDGAAVRGYQGETVLSVLFALGQRAIMKSDR